MPSTLHTLESGRRPATEAALLVAYCRALKAAPAAERTALLEGFEAAAGADFDDFPQKFAMLLDSPGPRLPEMEQAYAAMLLFVMLFDPELTRATPWIGPGLDPGDDEHALRVRGGAGVCRRLAELEPAFALLAAAYAPSLTMRLDLGDESRIVLQSGA